MSDVIVKLNIASRILVMRVLNNPEKVTADIPRKTRSINRAFKLKEADEERDKIAEPYERKREPILAYNEIQRELALEASKNNQPFTPKFKEDPGGLPWEDLSETGEEEFAINRDDLAWIKGVIEKYSWGMQKATNNAGQQMEIIIPVGIGMQCAIADLEDSLLAAFEKKEPKGGEEKPAES